MKTVLAVLLGLLITIPGFSLSLLSQGPVVLALNIVVLLGIVGFLIYLKIREKNHEEE